MVARVRTSCLEMLGLVYRAREGAHTPAARKRRSGWHHTALKHVTGGSCHAQGRLPTQWLIIFKGAMTERRERLRGKMSGAVEPFAKVEGRLCG